MTFSFPHTTPRLFARYLAGIVVVSIGATLGIQSSVGAAPYDALLVTVTDRIGTPFWLTAWILQAVWIALILRSGGRLQVATLVHSLAFGPIMATTLALIPPATTLLWSAAYLGASVLGIAFGIWLYLGSGFIAGIVDTLFETVSERGGWKPAGLRTIFDVACCGFAWIGGGPVGVGTMVIAFGVGPILGLFSSGMLRPASWRGIPLTRTPAASLSSLELVDTAEYRLVP